MIHGRSLYAAAAVALAILPGRAFAQEGVELRAARVCAGIGQQGGSFQGTFNVENLRVEGNANGTATVKRDGVDLGKIEKGTYQDYSKCLIEVIKLITPKSQNVPPGPSATESWVFSLRQHPLLPGGGLAGLKIGDPETLIAAKLKLGDSPIARAGYGNSQQNPSDGRTGSVRNYIINLSKDKLRLAIGLQRDKRTIIGFRLIDSDFNKDRWLPSYRGVTIGSLKEDLISSLGRPQVMSEHHSSNCMGAELRENNEVLYPYEGIAFSICKQNNLVYRIDIPGNHN
jgi:hypothetical protein